MPGYHRAEVSAELTVTPSAGGRVHFEASGDAPRFGR
jgi:hypothetical protein